MAHSTEIATRIRNTLEAASLSVSAMDQNLVRNLKDWIAPSVDPCTKPELCDEAQTCVFGCVRPRNL